MKDKSVRFDRFQSQTNLNFWGSGIKNMVQNMKLTLALPVTSISIHVHSIFNLPEAEKGNCSSYWNWIGIVQWLLLLPG